MQFKEFCNSLLAQLSAGYALENAIIETLSEMEKMFGDQSDICLEIRIMIRGLRINKNIEDSIKEFAYRSKDEDIILFSDIIYIAKQTGGDMIEIVKKAAESISDECETEREIERIINEKKYEKTVMNFIPIFIIIYMRMTSSQMMNVMYKTFEGKIIMTGCLIIYLFAFYLGNRLTDVKV